MRLAAGPRARRVYHLAAATHLGGAERCLAELVGELARHRELGWEPHVIVPKRDGPLVDALRRQGVSCEAIPMPSALLRMNLAQPASTLPRLLRQTPEIGRYLVTLARHLRDGGAALLHTNGLKCHAIGACLRAATGLPLLWHLRDIVTAPAKRRALRLLRRAVGGHVVAVSHAAAAAMGWHDDAVVIHDALPDDVYRPQPTRSLHRELGIDERAPLVGIVGAVTRWKGQLEFLRAAAELLRGGSDAHFAVVGGEIYDTDGCGGHLAELRSFANHRELRNRVHFTGFRQDNAAAVNALDVLVHASIRAEPFGRVIVEAMACGIPLVASAAGGVLEIVRHGDTALLHRPGDVGDLVAQLGRLLADERGRLRLADRARAEFHRRFTLDRHAVRVAALYDRIASA